MTPEPIRTGSRHPEVFALVAICLICAGASRTSERVELKLSAAPYQVEQGSSQMCERTQMLVTKLQSKLEAAAMRLQERVQARTPHISGL